MKNSIRFATIFVLAGSVLLAGCGTKSNVTSSASSAASVPTSSTPTSSTPVSSPDSSSVSSVVAPTITIADTLEANAKSIVVGDVINLADYVTVTPTCTWTIAATNDNVTIDGQSFTAAKPGAYQITITAGQSSASFKGTVISAALDAIESVLTDEWGGTNYTATLMKGTTTLGYAEHNDSYAMLSYNGAKQGFLVHVGRDGSDSSVYAFAITNDVLTVAPGKYDQALGFNSFTSAFPAAATDYVDELVDKVSDGKVVIASRPVMIPAIGDYTLGIDLSKLGVNKLVVTKGEDADGNSTLTYALYKDSTDLGYSIVCSLFESTTNSVISAYCNGDVVPTPYSQAEVNDSFSTMNTGKTYTLTAKCGWVDGNGTALDATTAASLSDDSGFPSETYTEYVNPTSLYVVTSSTSAVTAHITHADSAGATSLYKVTSSDGKTFAAVNEETAMGSSDVWAATSLASWTTAPFTADLLKTLDVMNRTEDTASKTVTLTGMYCPGTETLLATCLKAIPLVGEDVASAWDGYEPYFGDQKYIYDSAAKSLTISCDVLYSSIDDQHWVYSLAYSEIGTDAVPGAYATSITTWPAK
jgi:hypothetical protein